MTKTCAIIGCSPMCFPWGFDEEDEGCAALKLILINQISKLRGEGYMRFAVSMDCGVGLYVAEILHGLKGSNDALDTILNIPFEKTIETGQVGHFHRADCSVVPPRLVTISGAVVY